MSTKKSTDQTEAVEKIISKSKDAEAEKPVVGHASPDERRDALTIAAKIAADFQGSATAHGNQVIITFRNEQDLVQQFSLTVTENVREF